LLFAIACRSSIAHVRTIVIAGDFSSNPATRRFTMFEDISSKRDLLIALLTAFAL